MSSHLSADRPAAQPPGRGSVESLITQTRRLRGDVDAVRRDSRGDGSDPEGRWQRALYDLALHQLTDLDAHLAQLRDGPAPPPRAGSLLSRVGSAEWNLLTDEADWSAELFAILGRDRGSVPLSLDELPSLVPAEDRPKLTAMVTDCLVDGRPIDGEFRVVHPGGTLRTVHMMGEPVLDADGSTASMWAVLRDVSELRRCRRAVSESRDSLRDPAPRSDPGPHTSQEPGDRPGQSASPPWHGLLRFPHEGRPGLDLATAYLPPAASPTRTHRYGAWYDACPLAGGDETLLATGHLPGPDETGGPAVLIGALRGLAAAGTRPGQLPGRIAGFLENAALPPVHSALYCGYRPGTRALSWAHAGDPVPLLLFRDGAGHGLSGQAGATLRPGDLLLLHAGAPVAVERLVSLAPRLAGAESARDGARIVARALAESDPERTDACVLLARVTA